MPLCPLLDATPDNVPLIDPSEFEPTIRLMMNNVRPGQIHEPDFLFFRDISPHSVFCDIGANLGSSVLSFAAAGGRCETHSFEINPALYPMLRKMGAKTPNPWTLHEFGLAAQPGRHSLFIVKTADIYILGGGTLQLDFLQERQSIERMLGYGGGAPLFVGRVEVEVRTFDSLGLVPTHIKIDAEGAEPEILRGMRETLRTHKPILMIESGAMPAVDAELLPQGYKPYIFDANSWKLVPRAWKAQNIFYVHKATSPLGLGNRYPNSTPEQLAVVEADMQRRVARESSRQSTVSRPREIPSRRDQMMMPWAPEFIINKVFPGMRNGFFIDAGAATGAANESNTYLLEKSYGWSGLCVEPNQVFFNQLVALRSAYCVKACLHDQDGELDFINAAYYGTAVQHVHQIFAARGISDYVEKHENYQKDVLGPATLVKMPARSIKSLLQEMSYEGDVHYFSLDVEGGELFALRGYPFEKNRLLSATVESHYPAGDRYMVMCDYCMPVRELMKDNGLIYLKTEGVDDIFVHVDLLRSRF